MKATIEFDTSYDLSSLEAEWIDLETRCEASFFLSWSWIGCWLKTIAQRPMLVRARCDGRTMALGLFGAHRQRRRILSVRQFCLNETGQPDYDRITIEHNGFLAAADDLVDQIFLALRAQGMGARWDEIVLSGVSPAQVASAERARLHVVIDQVSPDYQVDLKKIRKDKRSWLDSVSANLRSQIRQSQVYASRIGPLALTSARTPSEALKYFDELRILHNAHWRAKGKTGAFSEDFSISFHKELLSTQFEKGRVELLRLSAGTDTLGYLYNFLYSGTVSSYQSGFKYLNDNRHRPGLLAHAFAIERAVQGGWDRYDFLAGDTNYKQRMGENAGPLMWCRAQQNRPLLVGERLVRKARRAFTLHMG